MRVKPEQLEMWREFCDAQNIDISSQMRLLMNAWCRAKTLEREARELMAMRIPEDIET